MRKVGIGTLIVLWMVQVACAGNLSIVSNGVTWISGDNPSCQFTLGVNNTGTTFGLTGWQLRCEIVRYPDASGWVHFGSISEPPNYVFSGITHNIAKSEESSLELLVALDEIFFPVLTGEAGPVEVPETGMNLLQIELTSYQAVGQFDIVVVAGTEIDSVWYSDTFDPMLFDVESLPGLPGVVESLVFVPEPSTIALLMSAIISIVLNLFRNEKTERFSDR